MGEAWATPIILRIASANRRDLDVVIYWRLVLGSIAVLIVFFFYRYGPWATHTTGCSITTDSGCEESEDRNA